MTKVERRAMWEERVQAYGTSGQSVAAWCRERNIAEHQMRYWLQRLTPKQADPVDAQWLTLGVAEPGSSPTASAGVLIHVGRCTIEVRQGVDRSLLADVAQVLLSQC